MVMQITKPVDAAKWQFAVRASGNLQTAVLSKMGPLVGTLDAVFDEGGAQIHIPANAGLREIATAMMPAIAKPDASVVDRCAALFVADPAQVVSRGLAASDRIDLSAVWPAFAHSALEKARGYEQTGDPVAGVMVLLGMVDEIMQRAAPVDPKREARQQGKLDKFRAQLQRDETAARAQLDKALKTGDPAKVRRVAAANTRIAEMNSSRLHATLLDGDRKSVWQRFGDWLRRVLRRLFK